MFHPGELIADCAIDLAVVPGAGAALDHAADAADPAHSFLRASWFSNAARETLVARRPDGAVVAAVPLAMRRLGPFAIREVPGSYWPFRSFPISRDASDSELGKLLGAGEARAVLGRAWRIGPLLADDPSLARLVPIARGAGWRILKRRLGACYALDLAHLRGEGPWPSSKTLRKNRWLERRLGEAGTIDYRSFSGAGWNETLIDRLAEIESRSWVADAKGGSDTKFLNPANRRIWESALRDPAIARNLSCSLLLVGNVPAAFNFSLRSGHAMHMIANSYDARFKDYSPGRILLYRDFQFAAELGVETIFWGAGDPGYKSEMGARPGPDIIDVLLVRGPLLAAATRLVWR